ncbi:uncharacterized protein LOC102410032 [Bubalus bubalis]|uniref:uncharacterized protein LOC102410032 n=1 Tax=Bubalus bubalis TaxID=89462 RepID=UPI00042D0A24|nr:uncharacterized protein LOC102410032 [Bubalus bubalis]
MFWLPPLLVLLGALAVPEGTTKTCPVCPLLGNCIEKTCPPAQDSCLLSQLQLANGTVIKNGSCVAPGDCRKDVYSLTYGPGLSLWIRTACCEENCSSVTPQEARPSAQPNGVQCRYCPRNKLAQGDSLSVMNCTGNQTVCFTLSGTWHGGTLQTLKGCATPEICHLQANTTLGPEASGFRLITKPKCSRVTPTTQPGPYTAHSKAKVTTCFTCSDLHHCSPLPCTEDRNHCLQTVGITVLGATNSVAWRNGSCVASKDCTPANSISALTYSIGFGFWVNTTCCQGNCQEPSPLAALPGSSTLSKFLCPTCPGGHSGPCSPSFYMQCPSRESECIHINLVSEVGGRNLSVRGCGTRDLCQEEGFPALPGHRLAGPPVCNARQRAILDPKCHSGAALGLRLALPVLTVALGTATLS